MKSFKIVAVMGILTGLASFSQAQSYLTKSPMKFTDPSGQSRTKINTTAKKDSDAPDKQFDLKLSLLTKGSRIVDDNIKASTSASSVGVEFTWHATTWAKFDLFADYQFATGLAATVYGSESSPYTGSGISEGSVTITPTDGINLSGGIVGTEFNPLISIFGGDALAGFREVFMTKFKNGFEMDLTSYQAVPTQLGTSSRILDDKNDSYLILNNLNFGFVKDSFDIKLSYAKFDFFNMTRAAAEDSRYLGNTMVGVDGSSYRLFRYEFKGQEVAIATSIKFRQDDKWTLKGSLAQNDEAPEKLNLGWLANTSYEFNFSRYQIRPSYTQFRFESDVIPAFYSYGNYAYLNREGYSTELRGKIKTYNLETYIRYTNSNEIVDTLVQSDRNNYSIGLEVSYDVM